MSDITFKKQNIVNRKLYYIPTFPGAVTLFFCCWSHKLGLSETSSFPFQLLMPNLVTGKAGSAWEAWAAQRFRDIRDKFF